ncbi:MAG: ATP-binding cassette domain-containing protein, partial [Pseudonocardia sp.]
MSDTDRRIHRSEAVLVRSWVISFAVLALLLTGCSSGPPQQSAASDALVIALSDEPTNLNPIFGDLYGSIYGDHWPIFSSLLDYDQQLELTPDLAAALPEVGTDGLSVTVPLREGVRWHDGTPFTAADVVFTYRALLDPAVATGLRDDLFDSLASVDAVDPPTVRFGLSRLDPAFTDKLTLGIVPEHVLAGQDLCGPSGSGKSTLARILALLERPDAGEVVLDGEPVRDTGLALARERRLRVALLWQSPRLAADPRLGVGRLVEEPLRSGGRRHRPTPAELGARVKDVCERVGLGPELLERFPHEVSEGQLQRACLARALITEPSYLICDELTSMLDVSTQAALLEVIVDDLRDRDTGVLLITHDRVLAHHWCDRIV